LALLGDRMDEIDVELAAAEQAGDTARQFAALVRRADAYRDYGRLLERQCRDSIGAELAAQRAERAAAALESTR
jgi:hypothetical protein